MTGPELDLRRRIMRVFAETGAPPPAITLDRLLLERLQEQHVVVLDERGEIAMAHPFAAEPGGATVTAGGQTWWGNCAWDAYGIASALRLERPRIESRGVEAGPGVVFRVEVPAARWWEDIAFT